MFKYVGVALVLFSWASIGYLLTKWQDTNLPTISRHAASSKEATRLFAAVLIGCGLLFYIWLVEWLTPHLQLSSWFLITLTMAVLCQVVTGAIPDTHGRQRTFHRLTAYTMAVLYLPLGVFIITAPQTSTMARILCSLILGYMILTFVIVVLFKRLNRHYLKFQILYVMAFQVLLLSAAYL